jgi:hypothetical protein
MRAHTLLAVAALLPCTSALADAPQITRVATSRDGDHVVFEVQIARPPDMAELSIEQPWWSTRRLTWPRVPELWSDPPWRCPTYLEFPVVERHRGVPPLDRLVFVGRCGAAETLSLAFGYPTHDGGWHQEPLEIDLATAADLAVNPPPVSRWAAAEAAWFELLREYGRDTGGFLAYAEKQTRRRYGLDPSQRGPFWSREPGMHFQEAYDLISGDLAIQESLQLERMSDRPELVAAGRQRNIPIDEVASIAIESHPFDDMRADRTPVHSNLARMVPHDNWYARFRSVGKLLELLDFNDAWGAPLLRLAAATGIDSGTRPKLHRQLILPDSILARALGPGVISEVAVTGSDLNLRDGADVTVLFDVTAEPAFRAAVDAPFDAWARRLPPRFRETVTYRDVPVERLVTADRRICCHRCWLDGVCAYSNSQAAIERVIDTWRGERPALADTADFKYARAAVYPLDEAAEDGFLYFGDDFVRHFVGPALRIKQWRRREAATSLKMIANAALYDGWHRGPGRPTMEQLIAAGALNADDLVDPLGGTFSWDAERGVASSTTCNTLGFLTPLVEHDIEFVSAAEVDVYQEFRDRYRQRWRRYFDPIAIRLKIGRTMRAETWIVPLIESSDYGRARDLAGGEPIPMPPHALGAATFVGLTTKLNDGMMKREVKGMIGGMTGSDVTSDWIGDWASLWIEDSAALEDIARHMYPQADEPADEFETTFNDVFNTPIVLGVQATNKVSLAAFLVSLKGVVAQMAPDLVVFNTLEPYRGVTIVEIAPSDEGAWGTRTEIEPGIYYATIGDGFYASTKVSALRNLVDARQAGAAPADAAVTEAGQMAFARVAGTEWALPALDYVLEQQAREASAANLAQVWLLGRCGVLDDRTLDDAAPRFLGYALVCPDGGAYAYRAADNDAVSTIHGSLREPTRLEHLPEGSPLRALLDSIDRVRAQASFPAEGLATEVVIERR